MSPRMSTETKAGKSQELLRLSREKMSAKPKVNKIVVALRTPVHPALDDGEIKIFLLQAPRGHAQNTLQQVTQSILRRQKSSQAWAGSWMPISARFKDKKCRPG